MKKVISTSSAKYHITVDTEQMAALLYGKLYHQRLLAGDDLHPDFAMASPITRRLIEETAAELVKELNVAVEFGG